MAGERQPILIVTRGSALALAQTHAVLEQCRRAFPRLQFEMKIVKTAGDRLQQLKGPAPGAVLPRGMFTKDLEVALLKHRADLAVHSLKDLPTELPAGLALGAVMKRADVRDVLVYRDATWITDPAQHASQDTWTPGQAQRRGFAPGTTLRTLPDGAVIGTGSLRRQAQILLQQPRVQVAPIRGNVPTRLERLSERAELDALVLARAGLDRLRFEISADGWLHGDAVPDGLRAEILALETMLPCVGQGAIGIERRNDDERAAAICARLNHYNTLQAVTAERAFLRAMGGGCQSPLAAYAEPVEAKLRLKAFAAREGGPRRAEATGDLRDPGPLGDAVAAQLLTP